MKQNKQLKTNDCINVIIQSGMILSQTKLHVLNMTGWPCMDCIKGKESLIILNFKNCKMFFDLNLWFKERCVNTMLIGFPCIDIKMKNEWSRQAKSKPKPNPSNALYYIVWEKFELRNLSMRKRNGVR